MCLLIPGFLQYNPCIKFTIHYLILVFPPQLCFPGLRIWYFHSLSIRLTAVLFLLPASVLCFSTYFSAYIWSRIKRTKTSQCCTLITSKELSHCSFLFNGFVFFLTCFHCFLDSFSPIPCYFCPSCWMLGFEPVIWRILPSWVLWHQRYRCIFGCLRVRILTIVLSILFGVYVGLSQTLQRTATILSRAGYARTLSDPFPDA
jgi:hypothetical protein